MTLTQKQRAFSLCLAELIYWVYVDKGWEITIGEVERGREQQAFYVANGKSKTMNSKHLIRQAADLFLWIDDRVTYDPDIYKALGEKWEELGKKKGLDLRWGGRFGDNPDTEKIEGWDSCHFEIA